MPLLFNTLLSQAGIDPKDVRLLRHKDQRSLKGRSPYELWRDDRPMFEMYQSDQAFGNRTKLTGKYWAVFVGTPSDETFFAGLYSVTYLGINIEARYLPHLDTNSDPETADVYDLTLVDEFKEFDGTLFIEWGLGKRSWIQRADNKNKQIVELKREFQEPEFPGYLNFISQLSQLDALPLTWTASLKASRGIYLLTCPRTREQYVGSASGENGFWGRWQNYLMTGHGGNVELKIRDPSDYQVSILEVAGTSATTLDILNMEVLWKKKLQSREMGLNKN